MSSLEPSWVPFGEIAANDPAPFDCPKCDNLSGPDDIYCESCGYPVRGGDTERQRYVWRQESLEIDTELAAKRVRHGRNTLFFTGALSLVSGLILGRFEMAYAVSGFILAMVYVALGVWTNRKPFAALLTGLVVYLCLIGFDMVTNPINIGKGLLIKIGVIAFLIKGVTGTRELGNLKTAKRGADD